MEPPRHTIKRSSTSTSSAERSSTAFVVSGRFCQQRTFDVGAVCKLMAFIFRRCAHDALGRTCSSGMPRFSALARTASRRVWLPSRRRLNRFSSRTSSVEGAIARTSALRARLIRIAICPNISPRPRRQVCPAVSSSTAPEAIKNTLSAISRDGRVSAAVRRRATSCIRVE